MSEEFLKLQTRTMKDNLLFTGIPETAEPFSFFSFEFEAIIFVSFDIIYTYKLMLIKDARGTDSPPLFFLTFCLQIYKETNIIASNSNEKNENG
jgi:hypothetical protein